MSTAKKWFGLGVVLVVMVAFAIAAAFGHTGEVSLIAVGVATGAAAAEEIRSVRRKSRRQASGEVG